MAENPRHDDPDLDRTAFLRRALRDLARTSRHAHDRRTGRLAVTWRAHPRRDRIDGRPVDLRHCGLLALSHRWCRQGSAGFRPRVALALYRPVVDLPGSGRITFRCARALDLADRQATPAADPALAAAGVLLHRAVADARAAELDDALLLPEFYFAYDPARPPAPEATVPEDHWRAAAVGIDGLLAYPARLLARPAGRRWDIHPTDGSPCPFAGAGPAAEGAVAGSWVVREGLPTPMAQVPIAVYAALGHLRGRSVRNPAFDVLVRHGLIPAGTAYRAWLDVVAPAAADGRPGPRPGDDASPAGRFRRALGEHVLADLDPHGRSARLEALAGALRVASAALGVPLPEGRAAIADALVERLDSPWSPAAVPGAARVQVLRLGGDPAPETMAYSDGVVAADLFDLGEDRGWSAPMPGRLVRAALHRRPGPAAAAAL